MISAIITRGLLYSPSMEITAGLLSSGSPYPVLVGILRHARVEIREALHIRIEIS